MEVLILTKEQIDRLYDYTKFHIGLYAGLMTALVALLTLGKGLTLCVIWPIKATLICFALAGACGGVIGSTISVSQEALMNDKRVGPLSLAWLRADQWAHLEHWAFWGGVAIAVVGFSLNY
jgi:hypothetical protein